MVAPMLIKIFKEFYRLAERNVKHGEVKMMVNEKCNKELSCLIENCLWIEIYLALWHKIEMNSEQEHLSYYPNLKEVITKALIDASIMTLSKVYDLNSTGPNIERVLKDIILGKTLIDSEKINEIKEFSKKQNEELKGKKIKNLIYNLKNWRNNLYAHTDEHFLDDKYFSNNEDDLTAEDKLRKEFPINMEEFEQLLNFAKDTVEYLYKLINGYVFKKDIKMRCELEINLLFEILREHRENYLNLVEKFQKETQGKSEDLSVNSNDDVNNPVKKTQHAMNIQ